ncbi:hypothetical protein [Gluconobacter morbifer]|uniref:Uncharacterized protein n=1 Tax=Gluconobacter morbifer G707 TaxID=1088869 RepID=G6XMA5_9PROT|nr:hypothetical protein [Gluconobacter morbifer]EHH67003.1 hypothetical protein GMO_26230 [Gluconobacter morbifer G707]
MLRKNEISPGDIVRVGAQVMVVLQIEDALTACPLVSVSEPHHRADVELEWHELAEAGLARLDVRCRAIPCERRGHGLERLGRMCGVAFRRIEGKALREARQRRLETDARRSGKRVRQSSAPVRAVWMEGQALMSRRESRLAGG